MKPLKLKSTKKSKEYKAEIKITPMPKCCTECPFYYMPRPEDQGSWYEEWACYLIDMKNAFGIAIKRYKGCPLKQN